VRPLKEAGKVPLMLLYAIILEREGVGDDMEKKNDAT